VNDLTTSSSLACEHDSEAEFLVQHDEYIKMLVRKKGQCASSWISDLETDELAQRVRIKLWQALQKGTISNPRAYIRRVVDTVTIDMMRHYTLVLSLVIDEEGESYHGNLLITPSKGMQDPVDELVQKEEEAEALKKFIAAIIMLPPRQQYAVICTMKDNFDDIYTLMSAFKDFGIDIEPLQLPTGREDVQRLRASLSISRKKLRPLFTKSALEGARDVPGTWTEVGD
jgi:DNA-directed RNA polymerase specialized sigma24 family protein